MIKEYFRNFNIFSDKEIDEMLSFFKQKKLKKSELFIRENVRCSEIAFITSGIFRSYYLTEKGDENTFCFRFANQFLAPYAAFITGYPSRETMQAITDADLLVISKSDITSLIQDNCNWVKLLKINAETEYLDLEARYFQLQKNSAKERYLSLLNKQPQYLQKIPLQYLASYLGISQRHLSRIRSELTF